MRKKTGRRMNPVSAYIGSGNKTSFFTNRPKSPFSRIKQIYGEELERFEIENSSSDFQSKELLIQHRKEIKERVLEHYRKEQKQNYIIIGFMTLFVIILIIFVNYYLLDLIKSYWP